MFKIIVITGPTGVGKTKMSIELAKKYNAEIINADSIQIYKELDIGSAKIKEEEKEGIKHHLFDIKEVTDDYSVYDYQIDCRSKIEEIKKHNKNVIIVGGTGLYIKAALYDYKFTLEDKNDINTYDDYSNDELYTLLLKKDPNTLVHKNNRKRVIRELNRKGRKIKTDKLLYPALFIGLTTPRENLYKIINERVDKMINNGLLQETKKLYDRNIRSKAIMTGIGYKELYKYFDGEITLDEAIELIKRNSRRYAKRQYTWFNNQMNIKWFDVNYKNFEKTIEEVSNYIDNY